MKNKKRINLVAALAFGLFFVAGNQVSAEPFSVTDDFDREIEIVGVKDDLSLSENILKVSCPCQATPKAVNPRVKSVDADCGCETGAAIPPPCPCEEKPAPCAPEPDPCDPCAEPDPCDVSPACPVSDPCEKSEASPCPVASCDNDCGPACATSPSFDKDALSRIQVYSYPRNINLWGNDITSNGAVFNNGSYASGYNGVMLGHDSCGCTKSSGIFMPTDTANMYGMNVTGAAAGIPVQNNPCMKFGSPVDNSPEARANAGCPITIHSNSSIQVPSHSLEKLDVQQVTGAAVPLINTFDDVPNGYWASYDINKLAASKVIAGYPDQTFRPDRKVTRAEFAALAVSGLNYQGEKYYNKAIFSDVPESHWANTVIDKGVNGGLIAGYPNGKFNPNSHVTRTEALVILSKALPSCDIDDCKAKEILSAYTDGNMIPDWAKLSVAKAIQADALKKSPDCDNKMLRGNDLATRAEIAGMLSNMRIAMGIDPAEIACGCAETGAAAYVEVEAMKTYPTLKVKFDDQISAKDSQAGDGFRAYTTECVTIDGVTYPEGSIVRGKIVEVIRPSHSCKGALRIAFTEIQNGDCKSALPQEVLSAQVLNTKNPNIVAKVLKMPFTLAGALVGNTARTIGNVISQAGNGVEAFSNDFGTATGELFQGKFKASMRSYGQSGLEILKTPVQVAATTVSGVAGLGEVTVDEIAYVVSTNGTRISQISPNEVVQVAFSVCDNKTASKE